MKKVYYYSIMSAIALICGIYIYAYTVDKQYGSYEQQMLDLTIVAVFAGIGLLYYFIIPIQKNNDNGNN